jgi:hypothetical protein
MIGVDTGIATKDKSIVAGLSVIQARFLMSARNRLVHHAYGILCLAIS